MWSWTSLFSFLDLSSPFPQRDRARLFLKALPALKPACLMKHINQLCEQFQWMFTSERCSCLCLTFLTLSVSGSGSSYTVRRTTSCGVARAPKWVSAGLGCSATFTLQKELSLALASFMTLPFAWACPGRRLNRSWALYEISETWKVLSSKKKETSKWVLLARICYAWHSDVCKDSVISTPVLNPALGQAWTGCWGCQD